MKVQVHRSSEISLEYNQDLRAMKFGYNLLNQFGNCRNAMRCEIRFGKESR